MKYLKLYESFDNSDMKDLEDIFSLVIHDVQIEKIPYYYFNSDCKPDFYIYIIYGYLKNILSDREFLRELYGLVSSIFIQILLGIILFLLIIKYLIPDGRSL